MEKKKVLVVEDNFNNAMAAMQFFTEQTDIEAVIAETAESAIAKLNETVFYAAILDVNLPKIENGPVEKSGPEIGKACRETNTPYVYLTGGYYHHDRPIVKIFIDDFCLEHNVGEETTVDKNQIGAYREAYKCLLDRNLDEIYESRLRYFKHLGKICRRTEES